MNAAYVRNLARLNSPAAISVGRVVFNAAAEILFINDPLARERCIEALNAARVARSAREVPIGARTMVFFPVFDGEDEVEAVVGATGTLEDVPRLLHILQKGMPHFGEILHQTPNVVLTARPNGQIDYLSRQWYAIAGAITQDKGSLRPEDSLARAIPPGDYRKFSVAWATGIASAREFAQQVRIHTSDGVRFFELRLRPVRRNSGAILKWIGTLVDINDAALARDALLELKNRFQLLADASSAIASSQSLDEVADRLTSLPSIDARERWFIELRHAVTAATVRRNISDVESELIVEMLDHGSNTRAVEHIGVRRFVAATIEGTDHPLGFIGYSRDSTAEPTNDELTLVREVANRASIGIARMNTLLRERELARMLQRSMLPLALPYSPGVRLDVAYEPAQREALVGGDWYDAFELPDGLIAVAMGDVAGHGFDAAVVMNQVRHAMQTSAFDNIDPSSVLDRANRVLSSLDQPMVTALFGVLDPLTLTFSYASAGHLPPIVVDENGNARQLECDGIPLGVADVFRATTRTEDLPAGGALVLYTDGVVEDQRDLVGGEEALMQTLSRWALRGFLARASELQSQLRIGAHHDDAAMFVLRFPHVDEFEVRLTATPRNAQRLRLATRRFVAGSPFNPERAFEVVLAVGEAVNNAVLHAYGGDGSGSVNVILKRETERIVVEVRDEGMWRDAQVYDRVHGLGIIERLADKFDISGGENGTVVRIEVAFSSPQRTWVPQVAHSN